MLVVNALLAEYLSDRKLSIYTKVGARRLEEFIQVSCDKDTATFVANIAIVKWYEDIIYFLL